MSVLLAEWYAGDRVRDFLREAEAERLARLARAGRDARWRRAQARRWARPLRWLRVHLGHATV